MTATGYTGLVVFYSDNSRGPTDKYGATAHASVRDGKVVEPPPGVQFFDRDAFEAALARGESHGRCGRRWQTY